LAGHLSPLKSEVNYRTGGKNPNPWKPKVSMGIQTFIGAWLKKKGKGPNDVTSLMLS